ncbi:MAG: DUF2752 domain-containing protein [Lentisphaeria bacterium]|nr:DUF2752 domain-containing protein [Lentisphaeria bacterium]
MFSLLFAGAGILYLLTGEVWLCLFHFYTGLPCPGCGLTRAFLALLRGDLRASFQFHPLLLPVLFTLFTALAGSIAQTKEKAGRPSGKVLSFFGALHKKKGFYLFVFSLMILLYLVRMILFFPAGPEPMVFEKSSLPGILYDLVKRRF